MRFGGLILVVLVVWIATPVTGDSTVASARHGQSPDVSASPLDDPSARVFTLAGGGSSRAREGEIAGAITLGRPSLDRVVVAGLPNGSVATVDERGQPIAITLDGAVRRFPRPPEVRGDSVVDDLFKFGDGALGAVLGVEPVIFKLPPGARRWRRFISAAQLAGSGWVRGITTLADGRVAVSTDKGIWAISNGGIATRWGDASRTGLGAITGLPDGGLAVTRSDSDGRAVGVELLRSDGTLRASIPTPPPREGYLPWAPDLGLLALSSGTGTVLRGTRTVDAIDGPLAPSTLIGGAQGLGLGDGEPPNAAVLGSARLAMTSDDAVVVGDLSAVGAAPRRMDQVAIERQGRIATTGFYFPTTALLRIVVPVGTARLLVAVDQRTFISLQRGLIAVRSTQPGTVVADLRTSGGHLVARARGSVARGVSTLRLARRPPAGTLRLDLLVTDYRGRHAAARTYINTTTRLSAKRARDLAQRIGDMTREVDEGGGYFTEIRRCQRRSIVRIDCQMIDVEAFVGSPAKRACGGVAIIRLRPDGARGVRLRSVKACRRLSPP